jgi:hypothetical protein
MMTEHFDRLFFECNRWTYLAQPYTGFEGDAYERALEVVARCFARGRALGKTPQIFSPILYSHHLASEGRPEQFYAFDLQFIVSTRPVMLFMPGYQFSKGCRIEAALAHEMNLPCWEYLPLWERDERVKIQIPEEHCYETLKEQLAYEHIRLQFAPEG